MSKPLVMVFLGAPGAGKGTYCKEITAQFGALQVSTGDMFRAALKEGREVGLSAKAFMEKGELVPDGTVLGIVKERLSQQDCRTQGVILDGFPRTIAQADALPGLLNSVGLELTLVVNLDVDRDVIIKRLTGRRMCRGCNKGNFNVYTLPSKVDGICDYCGSELYQRDDDKLEVILNRLSVYDQQTQPLIAYYREKGALQDLAVKGDIAEMSKIISGMITKAQELQASRS